MLYNKVFNQRELRKSAPYPFFDNMRLLIKMVYRPKRDIYLKNTSYRVNIIKLKR